MLKSSKCTKLKCDKTWKSDQKSVILGGGLISALKPGPVVPPGTQKVPNQAARISQSVSFGHLSDILTFFRGGSFFDHFSHFFTFMILSFSHFCIFWFLSILMIFDFLHFWWFWVLLIFDHFLLFFNHWHHFWSILCLNYVPQLWHTFLLAYLHSHYPPFW